MGAGKIPIVELFGPVVQGEGALCGQVSYFLRSGYCSFECLWCDSLHAVLPKEVKRRAEYLAPEEIVERICALAPEGHKPCWVTLSGGDPLLWDMYPVVLDLKVRGFKVAVETQAHLWKDWLEACDLVTASPKPPSSGMSHKFRIEVLQKYEVRLEDRWNLKIVCFTQEDLAWAAKVHVRFPRVRFFLSSGTPMAGDCLPGDILEGYRELSEDVLKNYPLLHDATILLQLHALLYGKELGR